MTARKVNVLACDKDGCAEQIPALDRESAGELRARARKQHGWRSIPSFNEGGHTDLCRWHG
ncbi:hypothetical protein [Microbacterium sp. 22242]|uniref:hypothetical protein n=1 Tax=Microbacterium sp. 22242 TaxID=3453896 RepID=UPI003F84174A